MFSFILLYYIKLWCTLNMVRHTNCHWKIYAIQVNVSNFCFAYIQNHSLRMCHSELVLACTQHSLHMHRKSLKIKRPMHFAITVRNALICFGSIFLFLLLFIYSVNCSMLMECWAQSVGMKCRGTRIRERERVKLNECFLWSVLAIRMKHYFSVWKEHTQMNLS